MTAEDEKGHAQVVTPGREQLRERFRAALDQFIDPDDDTMPYCNRVDGGYTWAPVDGVIDRLVQAAHEVADAEEPS